MKQPAIIKGTFSEKGEVSQTLALPPGRIAPLYRIQFRHKGKNPGHVAFQMFVDDEQCWRDTWYGSVRSSSGFMSKDDGKARDVRLVCTYCPEPIDYAISYIRPDELRKAFEERPFFEQLASLDAEYLWPLVEDPDAFLWTSQR